MRRVIRYVRSLVQNHRRKFSWPRMLTYTVTFACNAKCIMCDSWKMTEKGDLTLDELEQIIPQLPKMDAVRLTGGEPFVRKDMLEIAHLIQKHVKPMILHVTTNGFLTERIVEFCEKRDKKMPLMVLVSIDGMNEKHNEIRGNSNAFDHVHRTIEALAPRRKELRIQLAVNQTIVDAEGIDHYRQLREFLRPYGVRNQMVMAYDISATYNLERDLNVAPTEIGEFTTFGQFSVEQVRELVMEVEKDLPNYPLWERMAKRYYLRGIANRLLKEKGTPNPKCVALQSHLRIFPNGDVPTCQFNSQVVGNLRNAPFEEVWQSASAEKQRDWVRKCAGCWAECEVLPSALYTADLLKEAVSGPVLRQIDNDKPPTMSLPLSS